MKIFAYSMFSLIAAVRLFGLDSPNVEIWNAIANWATFGSIPVLLWVAQSWYKNLTDRFNKIDAKFAAQDLRTDARFNAQDQEIARHTNQLTRLVTLEESRLNPHGRHQ